MTSASLPVPSFVARLNERVTFLTVLALFSVLAFLAPPAAFSIDDVIYIDMAEAMAERGSLNVSVQSAPQNAPPVTKSGSIVHLIDNEAIPQYPAGYGLVAAPFFALFGVSGLLLLNGLAGAASVWLTWRIAVQLYADRPLAGYAATLLLAATIFSGYLFAIWPHMAALAAVLGGTWWVLKADNEPDGGGLAAAIGGFLFGLGLLFRVDAFVLFIAAYFWLRMFAQNATRLTALGFLSGAAPSFILAAFLNWQKFGVFLPIYYGAKDGFDSAASYFPLAAVCFGAMAASLAVDFKKLPRLSVIRNYGLYFIAIALLGLVAVLSFETAWKYLRNLYFLTIDIQTYDNSSPQIGVALDSDGYWSFWGLPKKALVQSMPFIALLLIPIVAFFRGKNLAAHGLCLLMIAAPVAFFSLKGFHGGMAFNMRYFLPAVPFIAILSAYAIGQFSDALAKHPKAMLRAVILGAFCAIVFYQLAPASFASIGTPLQLYPQVLLFAALLGLLAYRLFRGAPFGLGAVLLTGTAIGYSLLVNVSDTVGYLDIRGGKMKYEWAYKAAIPSGSLVVSAAEDYLTHASLNGVHVARARRDDLQKLKQTIKAYKGAGRCIYIHTRPAFDLLGDDRFAEISVPGLRDPMSELALFAPPDASPLCKFSKAR